jgi:NAD-dependent SIR2 family protein deacetylase
MGNGIIPRWSQNAGYLLATQILHGGEARLNCTRCGTSKPLNLALIIQTHNPLWSPWHRRPICPTCKGAMMIHGSWSKKAFVVPFLGAGEEDVAQLHRAWMREHRRLTGNEKV